MPAVPTPSPPHEWIVARRVDRAAALLRARHAPSLDDVARATGHASASHLVRRFKAAWGVTPGQYRAAAGASPEGSGIASNRAGP